MNLTDKANAIISQPALTDQDVTELQKIRYEMSCLYSNYLITQSDKETSYNKDRANKYLEYRKKAKESGEKYTEKDIEMMTKKYAEEKRGDYRITDAKAKWFKAIIDAISSVCIDYYAKQKSNIESSR